MSGKKQVVEPGTAALTVVREVNTGYYSEMEGYMGIMLRFLSYSQGRQS